jgi:uncharacterized Ntn-hydrolase superfamily protein
MSVLCQKYLLEMLMPYPSTFSIVAYDPDENAWGISVASKFLAVGAIVPWARAGAGAVATQSYANTSYGPDGLDLMGSGLSANEALARLLNADPQADHRQVGLVDRNGDSATFTGSSCHDWAGGVTGKYYAVQGNILVGEQVVNAMAQSFENIPADPLISRLYNALLAGDKAGGDRRGRQSASILIVKPDGGYAGFNDRWVDYRVDDDPDPVKRLGELLELHNLYFGKSPASEQVELSGEPLCQMQSLIANLGYYTGPIHGELDAATRLGLETFIGNENFEERIDFTAGHIDRPVFDYLLKKFGEHR